MREAISTYQTQSKGDQRQSEAIRVHQEANQRSSGGQSEVIRRAIRVDQEGNQRSSGGREADHVASLHDARGERQQQVGVVCELRMQRERMEVPWNHEGAPSLAVIRDHIASIELLCSQGVRRHLPFEVITRSSRGHQRSSEVITRSSEAISGYQRSSEVIRGHQRPSAAISGHQRPSEVISGHQKHSLVLSASHLGERRQHRL